MHPQAGRCCCFNALLNVLFYSRHAGVYTAEEVALIMREKLIRLQSLYIDQFKRLQHLLKEKKRRYLHSRKVEHEALGKCDVLESASYSQ